MINNRRDSTSALSLSLSLSLYVMLPNVGHLIRTPPVVFFLALNEDIPGVLLVLASCCVMGVHYLVLFAQLFILLFSVSGYRCGSEGGELILITYLDTTVQSMCCSGKQTRLVYKIWTEISPQRNGHLYRSHFFFFYFTYFKYLFLDVA